MAGILHELFNVRTEGNGQIRSGWDDVLLKRDLERLITEERVRVVKAALHVGKDLPGLPAECARRWFLDCETGDIYQYTEGWERGGPRFEKVNCDAVFKTAPNRVPM
jgi:hypothetical protein